MTFKTVLDKKPLPPGTRVVTVSEIPNKNKKIPRGTLAQVVGAAGDLFIIKFNSGLEVAVPRSEFQPHRDSFRAENIEEELTYDDIEPHLLFRFVVGSTAYGLGVEGSDKDYAGCYLLPSHLFWGIKKYQETVTSSKPDGAYHELRKLVILACKGNPNIIELGQISRIPELVEVAPAHPLVSELFERWNSLFVSKYVFRSYLGYSSSQFKRLESDLKNKGEIRNKHAAHLLRLLWSGIHCMRYGEVVVRPREISESMYQRLMDVRNGEFTLEQLEDWRLGLEQEFEDAYRDCELPDEANYEEANKLLQALRLAKFSGF